MKLSIMDATVQQGLLATGLGMRKTRLENDVLKKTSGGLVTLTPVASSSSVHTPLSCSQSSPLRGDSSPPPPPPSPPPPSSSPPLREWEGSGRAQERASKPARVCSGCPQVTVLSGKKEGFGLSLLDSRRLGQQRVKQRVGGERTRPRPPCAPRPAPSRHPRRRYCRPNP